MDLYLVVFGCINDLRVRCAVCGVRVGGRAGGNSCHVGRPCSKLERRKPC